MTKIQKAILIILAIEALLLGIGLIVLYKEIGRNTRHAEPTPEPSDMSVVAVSIPTSEPTAAPTMHPVVEIHVPAPGESPEVTVITYPISSEPVYTAMPTPEPALVHFPTGAPVNTSVPSVPKDMAFTLSILGKTINVANNVEEDTLEKTPGWLPTSAKPGKEGTCVVYGHRNRNHLLVLKDIEIGDEIDVILPDGKVYTYVVDKTEILETNEAMRIPTTEDNHLILMTCYPFYYTGHAPRKFITTCTLKEGDN